MTTNTNMDIINELENKYPVEKWMLYGIHFWPLVRIPLGHQLLFASQQSTISTKSNKNKPSLAASALLRMARCAKVHFNDHVHDDRADRTVDAVFLTHTECRQLMMGTWRDVFCGPFIRQLEERGLKSFLFEDAILDSDYRFPRQEPSMLVDLQYLYSSIKNRFSSGATISTDDHIDAYDNFLSYVKQKFPSVSVPDMNTLRRNVGLLRAIADYFKNILIRLTPSLGFVVTYESPRCMSFLLACRELNILSVEIQHGLQDEYHPAYSRWTKFPENGYATLPAVFWNWSAYESEHIGKWDENVKQWHKHLAGGNLWINVWKKGSDPIVDHYSLQVANHRKNSHSSLVILVTLQPMTELHGHVVPPWLLQAINDSPPTWNWWFRLHPSMHNHRREIKDLLRKCSHAGVELDFPSDVPLLALLKYTDVHATQWSSTVIEAEAMGVPSIILSEFGSKLYAEQVASGKVLTAYNGNDLLKAISYQAGAKHKLPTEQNRQSDGLNMLLEMAERQRVSKRVSPSSVA